MNFENEKDLLKLKREITSRGNNIYLETKKIENLKKVVYRLRKSHPLPKTPDEKPYRKYILEAGKKLSTDFKNLSGDTVLVIPVKPYSNIYQFAKNGSEREWLALFRRVVKNFKKGQYISTHGHGVSWLHIRIEDYPKYFTPF
jgi:hypothetical protein